jgi:dTDP-4-dehydrorhamnose reductase
MTRYLIAGAGGMLGTALRRVLTLRSIPWTAPSEAEFDITDREAVAAVVRAFADELPAGERGVLVNAAAYTNVERAEEEPHAAFRVNEDGARILAEEARRTSLDFVHVSTDFVFDGTKDGAYNELDEPRPLSAYGESKLAGEVAVAAADPGALIVRTAWTYGPGGVNFASKILDAADRLPELRVVTDEVGSPTFSEDLAMGVVGLVEADARGLYHLAGSGSCSRFELAREILRLAGSTVPIVPVLSAVFPTKARRPANSVLDCSKAAAIGVVMPTWRDAVARYMAERTTASHGVRAGGGV